MKKVYDRRLIFFILVGIALIMVLALVGCTKVETVPKASSDDDISMFVELEETPTWKIVYHKETRVMYAVSSGDYNSGDFTVLVNPDGMPMLYEGSQR